VLAAYLAINGDQDLPAAAIGLWVMTGVIKKTAGAVLMINRRRPYCPLKPLAPDDRHRVLIFR
jgi:hypothetical protein